MKFDRQKYKFYLNVKPVKKEDKTNKLMVEVWHSEGGMSICADKTLSKRSKEIICSITPIEETPSGIQIMQLTAGLMYPLEVVTRRNEKKLWAHLEAVTGEVDHKTGRAWTTVLKVLEKHQLELI
jgi:hypothetical protein